MTVHIDRRGEAGNIVKELLENISVTDWLDEQGVTYRKGGGGQLQVKECPFCSDSRWKVYMRADDGRGICFHGDCNARFNLWTFARETLGTDNAGVVRHFEDFGRSMGVTSHRPEPIVKTSGVWELPDSVALPTAEGYTHPFLMARKITLRTQAEFGLRWCEKGHYDYEDPTRGHQRMNFSERIIIPVADLDGTVKTFQGRDVTGNSSKRYLFPPLLPGSGRFLYGGHLAKGCSHLVMNEGCFDVMATHQAIKGHPDFRDIGAVGSFGLTIGGSDDGSDDQLARLRQLHQAGLQTVTMMWDGEARALNAALEAGMLLRRQGLTVKIALLPHEKDPNEVDTSVVREAIVSAIPLTSFSYMQLRMAGPYPAP